MQLTWHISAHFIVFWLFFFCLSLLLRWRFCRTVSNEVNGMTANTRVLIVVCFHLASSHHNPKLCTRQIKKYFGMSFPLRIRLFSSHHNAKTTVKEINKSMGHISQLCTIFLIGGIICFSGVFLIFLRGPLALCKSGEANYGNLCLTFVGWYTKATFCRCLRRQ